MSRDLDVTSRVFRFVEGETWVVRVNEVLRDVCDRRVSQILLDRFFYVFNRKWCSSTAVMSSPEDTTNSAAKECVSPSKSQSFSSSPCTAAIPIWRNLI